MKSSSLPIIKINTFIAFGRIKTKLSFFFLLLFLIETIILPRTFDR